MTAVDYRTCGYCNWYGKADALESVKITEIHRVGEVRMAVPYWEDRCPDCHKGDGINDAAPPCERCETYPMEPGYDYCAACCKLQDGDGRFPEEVS